MVIPPRVSVASFVKYLKSQSGDKLKEKFKIELFVNGFSYFLNI